MYQLLADYVVNVCRKPALFARQSSQLALGRVRASCLQLGTQRRTSMTNVVSARAGEVFAVASLCYIHNAEINPKHAFYFDWLRFFYFARGEQVKVTVDKDEVTLALPMQRTAICADRPNYSRTL